MTRTSAGMTGKQLSEWEAYDRLDPVGDWRSDFRMAYLAMLIVNTARAIHGKRGIKMDEVIDHMPRWDEEMYRKPVKQQTPEEMKQAMLAIVRGMGGAQKKRAEHNKVKK